MDEATRALELLRHSARVSPILQGAVGVVEREIASLRAALREAGQYEQMTVKDFDEHRGPLGIWQTANGKVFMGDPAGGGVPLYRKSTEAGSSASTSATGSSAPAAPIDTPRSEQG